MAGPIRKTTTTTKTTTTRRRTSGARNTFDAIVRGAERAIRGKELRHPYITVGSNLARAAQKAAKVVKKRKKAPTYKGYISKR
tara:strand:- start:227 stop:475 length:249 start_codon:yes stop_codon:yes gene_type:complete